MAFLSFNQRRGFTYLMPPFISMIKEHKEKTDRSQLINYLIFMQKCVMILLLGDSGVGKTSIAQRFVSDKFEAEYEPTIQIKHTEKEILIEQEKIIVQVVDTIGLKTENDLPIISKNIQIADGIFVILDLNSKNSIEMARFWLNEIKQHKETKEWQIVTVLANKSDKDRQISQDQIYMFSQECSTEVIEISAAEDVNISRSFKLMGEQIIKARRNIVKSIEKPSKLQLLSTHSQMQLSLKTNSSFKQKKDPVCGPTCLIY